MIESCRLCFTDENFDSPYSKRTFSDLLFNANDFKSNDSFFIDFVGSLNVLKINSLEVNRKLLKVYN